jgi:P27 family predicted phage terminase small subunit
MRGRKPKPTAAKELAGNPGKRPLNDREPKPAVKLPTCPAHLSAAARREWRRMGRQLLDLGVLTTVDRAVLAAYCVAYARWAEAEAQVSKLGLVVKTSAGNLIQNPYLSIANRAMEQTAKLASEFGMTPSSRSRVQTAEGDSGPSLADVLFGDVIEMEWQEQDDADDQRAD